VSLLGIRHIVLAINKMDLVDYSQQTFDDIVAAYREFAQQIGLTNIVAVPLSALRGDNILERSARTPWYEGPTLMGYLESVEIEDDLQTKPFRLAVQWVNRPNQDFRGFAGTIASGKIRRGDTVRVMPSGRQSRVTRIVSYEGDLETAVAGQSITLTLADEVDVSRGDMLAAADAPPAVSDQFPGDDHLDARRADAARSPVHHQAGYTHAHRQHHDAAAQSEREHAGAPRGEAAGAERDRRVQPELRSRDPVRSVSREPRDRRLHPDRQASRTTPSARAC
jgi:sulfate adenylyltransferase subunit 1 (EFTu-like GTPase family)